ncbi:MAG TPA: class I SAM-dependent methyltransferase [Actinomycetota bacterium]|nr:class I SAM-dependent methyltransferase [Actinomycetota bacterium]
MGEAAAGAAIRPTSSELTFRSEIDVDRLPAVPPPRPRSGGFDESYNHTPPWDIGRPQPALAALAASGQIRGRVLDVGCGTGEHTLMAAGLGLVAVGIDQQPRAIEKARAKAAERDPGRKLTVNFEVGDALDPVVLAAAGPFDTVLDCGLFHVFDDPDRPVFARALAAATAPGAHYFLLCFNEHVPGDWGPRRVTQAEIHATFSADAGWRVDGIEAASFSVLLAPDGVPAWLAALTRL